MARLGSRRTVAVCGALALSFGLAGCGSSAPRGLPTPVAPVSAAVSSSAAPAGGGTSTTSAKAPAGMPGDWQVVFDDEFTGDSLNTKLWSTGWLGSGITPDVSGSGVDCNDPKQVSVTHGNLALAIVQRTETCGGRTQQYAAGAINTEGKETFLYGAFEARIYLPPTTDGTRVANWPAWWTDGKNWPTDGEMDIAEGLGGLACYHLRYTEATAQGACAPGNLSGWHTFGADWEHGSVTYYYDGYNVGVVRNAGITQSPQFLVLDYEARKGPNYINVPATMLVDYVRVWKH